jgi:hypothetical protein
MILELGADRRAENESMFVPDEPKKERKNLSKFPLL